MVHPVGCCGRGSDEFASPLIQRLLEVVQDIVGFTNCELEGGGRNVGLKYLC